MQFKTKPKENPIVELIPLIDVVLLLLIFFMVTTQFVTLPGLKLTLPGIEPGSAVTTTDKLEVQFTAGGDIYVNGNPTAEKDVAAALKKQAKDLESAVVVLMADELVPHGRIVSLMDQIRRTGLHRVALAARMNAQTKVVQ